MHYLVFLDESGSFSLKAGDNFIAGWICAQDQVESAFQRAEPALAELRRLNTREPGIVHLYTVSQSSPHASHKWQAAYNSLIQSVSDCVYKLVRADAPRLHMIGPTEAWHYTLLRLVLGVLASGGTDDTFDFHVSQRLKPIETWLGFYDDADRYFKRIKEWLVSEVKENSGLEIPKHSIHFLMPPGFTKPDAWERTAQELADTFCSIQNSSFRQLLPAWAAARTLQISSSWKIRSERRILEDATEKNLGLGQILYSLIEAGDPSDSLLKSLPDRMSTADWKVLCQEVENGLLEELTSGEGRHLRLQELSDNVESIPSDHRTAPPRLRYLTDFCRLRLVAHEGGWDHALLARLQDLIAGQGTASPFLSDLERLQARIDLALLEAQLNQVNTLSPQLGNTPLLDLLAWYRQTFPSASKDRYLAALHGTVGQLRALTATPLDPDRTRNLELAMEQFRLDELHAPTAWDASLALGFQVATAFQQADLETMTRLHLRECQEAQPAWSKLDAALPWTPELLCKYPFLALHHAQWHALRNRSLNQPSPDSTQLIHSWAAVATQTRSTFPLLLVGKWVAILVAQDGDWTEARNAVAHLELDPPNRIWLATDWMRLVVKVLDLELEQPGTGLEWLEHWIEQQDAGPDRENARRVGAWLLQAHAQSGQDRLWSIARSLPFTFS